MSVTFGNLRPLLLGHDPAGVRELLRDATPHERSALVGPLKAHVAAVGRENDGMIVDGLPALYVAAAGCLPTLSELVAFLNRREFRWSWADRPAELVVAALDDRAVDWLPDLVERLAGQLDATTPDRQRWAFVAGLARGGGVPPPTADVFVGLWLRERRLPLSYRVIDHLRRDPWLSQLTPRIFDLDGWGAELLPAPGGRTEPQDAVAGSLALLCGEGLLDRAMLLDGCLNQFLRGGRQSHLRGFVALYQALEPTPAEAAARARDLLRLLPDAYGVLAGVAHAALRAADRAGLLSADAAIEAGQAVLRRADKKLFRDQVTWLGTVARREPERVDDVVRTLAVGFRHPAAELAERALEAALGYLGSVRKETLLLLADAAADLPPHLRDRAAVLRPSAPAYVPPTLPPVTPVTVPFPEPVASPAELAEEVAALWLDPGDLVRMERVLAGIVAFAHDDRDKLVAALAPVAPDLRDDNEHHWWSPLCLHGYLGAVLRQVRGDPQRPWWQERMRQLWRPGRLSPDLRTIPGPQRVLILRITELAAWLDRKPVPALVATPTTHLGQIAAGVLVARVAAAERAGWQPWPSDLAQALLRLPREVDGDAVTRAQRLTSPAGRRLVERLTAGPPPAVMSERRVLRQRPRERGQSPGRGEWGLPPLRVQVQLAAPPDADLVVSHLADLAFGAWLTPFHQEWTSEVSLWPAVAPSHREAIAAWALQHLACLADEDRHGGSAILPMLAETTGPVGPALTAALAYVLGARHDSDRVAATDALLMLAAAGDLPADALGEELGQLMAAGVVKVNRVTSALADASRAGAAPHVWRIVAACLPAVLAADPVPRQTAELLALASETVAMCGGPSADDQVQLTQLSQLAARAGRGRLVTEARRLAALLVS